MKLPLRSLTVGAVLAIASTALAQSENPSKATNPKEFEGTFALQPQSVQELVIEVSGTAVGATIATATPGSGDNQKWVFTAKGDGYYTISPACAKDLVVGVQDAGTANSTPVVLETNTGKDSQLWFVEKLDDGNVAIHPKHNLANLLDTPGGHRVKTPGNQIKIWQIFRHPNTWWKLLPAK